MMRALQQIGGFGVLMLGAFLFGVVIGETTQRATVQVIGPLASPTPAGARF